MSSNSGNNSQQNNQQNNSQSNNSGQNQQPLTEQQLLALLLSQAMNLNANGTNSNPNPLPILNMANQLNQTEEDMDEIIHRIMQADNNTYGPPPAAPLAVSELDDLVIEKKDLARKLECGVCGDTFSIGDYAKKLPCKHWFHADECLFPWLKRHNTCPLCRFELPTLDTAYEDKRREERQKKRDADRDRSEIPSMYI